MIRSEETTAKGDKESRAEWMWVTNLPYAGDLENGFHGIVGKRPCLCLISIGIWRMINC